MACDNDSCDEVKKHDFEPGWTMRDTILGEGKTYCPRCSRLINLVECVRDGKLTVDEAVEELLND